MRILLPMLTLGLMLQTTYTPDRKQSRSLDRETRRSFIAHTCMLGLSFVCVLAYRKYRMMRQEKLTYLLESQLIASQEFQKLLDACKQSNDLLSSPCKELQKTRARMPAQQS